MGIIPFSDPNTLIEKPSTNQNVTFFLASLRAKVTFHDQIFFFLLCAISFYTLPGEYALYICHSSGFY